MKKIEFLTKWMLRVPGTTEDRISFARDLNNVVREARAVQITQDTVIALNVRNQDWSDKSVENSVETARRIAAAIRDQGGE